MTTPTSEYWTAWYSKAENRERKKICSRDRYARIKATNPNYFAELRKRHKKAILQRTKLHYSKLPKSDSSLKVSSKFDMKVGKTGEQIALDVLPGSSKLNRPADLSWNGQTIEVKTARKRHPVIREYATGKPFECQTYCWKFYLHQKGRVDKFLLLMLDTEGKLEHALLIPDSDIEVKNLNISERSLPKYQHYYVTL